MPQATTEVRPRLRPHPRRCAHGRLTGRFCSQCVYRRRRISAQLDAIIRDLDGHTESVPPSTYSLDDDDLRTEANRLHTAGWSVDEITSVLAITPAGAR